MSTGNQHRLNSNGWTEFLSQFSSDFLNWTQGRDCPETKIYRVAQTEQGFVKQAFDTRNTNQEIERNPRENLQYYHRSDPFISSDLDQRFKIIGTLFEPVENLKQQFSSAPEYHNSYLRVLAQQLDILKAQQLKGDLADQQLNYLKQLLLMRYRISTDDLQHLSNTQIKQQLLSIDERLLKRGQINSPSPEIIKDSVQHPENIIQALFGNGQLRKGTEKTVERTVTITIRDQVID